MAITPESEIDLEEIGVDFQPTLTYWLNPKTHRLEGTVEGLKAMAQNIEVILNTERFQWGIYGPYTGMQWEGLIGQEPGYVAAEVLRRMKDAFSVDPRILGINSYSYTVAGDAITIEVIVSTVYGNVAQRAEVNIG